MRKRFGRCAKTYKQEQQLQENALGRSRHPPIVCWVRPVRVLPIRLPVLDRPPKWQYAQVQSVTAKWVFEVFETYIDSHSSWIWNRLRDLVCEFELVSYFVHRSIHFVDIAVCSAWQLSYWHLVKYWKRKWRNTVCHEFPWELRLPSSSLPKSPCSYWQIQ